jgi:hypothetical protein
MLLLVMVALELNKPLLLYIVATVEVVSMVLVVEGSGDKEAAGSQLPDPTLSPEPHDGSQFPEATSGPEGQDAPGPNSQRPLWAPRVKGP